MKIYTQADFDNFKIDKYGRRICPSGDYSQIRQFGEGCSFGKRCSFENLEFDTNPYFIRVNGIGSRGDGCYIFNSTQGLFIRSGCWFGSESEFIARVKDTHKNTKYEKQYLTALELAKLTFAE